jgi:hypothetical protein
VPLWKPATRGKDTGGIGSGPFGVGVALPDPEADAPDDDDPSGA